MKNEANKTTDVISSILIILYLSEDWKVLPVSSVSLSSEIAGRMERFRK